MTFFCNQPTNQPTNTLCIIILGDNNFTYNIFNNNKLNIFLVIINTWVATCVVPLVFCPFVMGKISVWGQVLYTWYTRANSRRAMKTYTTQVIIQMSRLLMYETETKYVLLIPGIQLKNFIVKRINEQIKNIQYRRISKSTVCEVSSS